MNELLSSMIHMILNITAHVDDVLVNTKSPMGILVVAIIETPVVILLLASVLGKPRSRNVTLLFLGWIFFMFCAFVIAVFGLSYLLGIFY